MRQSALFVNTLREAPSDAEIASHRLLLKAGLIRQLAAGIYTYLPLARRVLRKLERIVHEEMDRAGAQEILMPALQPAELWKESGRYDVYGQELIRLTDRHERQFALGPTHEEVITELVKNEIGTYRKLPVTLYQLQTKFRDERRPRFGLLRGREFLMKDAYSFDTSLEGLDRSYRTMFDAYMRIFERCGLRFRAVEADAGAIGGEGGTHEFMALADIGEDTIVACDRCGYAANLEIVQAGAGNSQALNEGDSCPHCLNGELIFSKAIELGHVFKLGTKYSEKLGALFSDSNGTKRPVVMGCYGIGVSRMAAAIVEQNHDEKGIIWPMAVAPYHVHMIPVSARDGMQMEAAEQIYERLKHQGIEVLIDDRDERAGVKFNDSDLIGIPIRMIAGKQSASGIVEFEERGAGEKQEMQIEDAIARISKLVYGYGTVG
ncbi:proline--tRNA ligase [Paenibacillus thermotolerans]|uniref:proline--tRNA ligase n=1 Tax=Paenibacillus thermotolerans TaxID=3027807 RepID=UPI0023687148|nr:MULTISPECIES: proline--tRNA ligase [unclassified Paenibacillus]